ncbi:SixA phosphatase family protein [Microbacterium sp. P05]|uniref:SixA phosphatase family protein n=1 Tax=Microbacterium sp. P05 TaxID=3366948 RepID=UPI003744DE33
MLVRHASAEHGGVDLDDHERPLTSRGVRDAVESAKRTLRSGARPEVVLASTAVRARDTAAAFGAAFGADVTERADLYAAPAAVMLDVARANGAAEIAIVAHDPGMSALVSELTGEDIPMATGAVAILTWSDGDWDDVGILPPDEVTLISPN